MPNPKDDDKDGCVQNCQEIALLKAERDSLQKAFNYRIDQVSDLQIEVAELREYCEGCAIEAENAMLKASLSETRGVNTELLQQRDYLQKELVGVRAEVERVLRLYDMTRDKFKTIAKTNAELQTSLSAIRGIGVEEWATLIENDPCESPLTIATAIVAKLKEVGDG